MTDLTAITTPFGLLDDATREALKAHGGPYETYHGDEMGNWNEVAWPSWKPSNVYRVKPQPPKPQPPKPREFWLVGLVANESEADAARFLQELQRAHPGLFDDRRVIHVREVLP